MFKSLMALWFAAVSALGTIALAQSPDPYSKILGTWETIDRHIVMGSLYQPVHGVRKREGIVQFWQEGNRLCGRATHADHAAITHQQDWKDGKTDLRKVSFENGKLAFEFDIQAWARYAAAIAVEDVRLPNKATIRVEATFKGDRLTGKWGVFLTDGTEPFRGEWEAVPAAATSNSENSADKQAEQKSAAPTGSVMLIGGRHQDLPNSIRHEFFERAGGTKAKIIVIPTAIKSPEEPAVADELLGMWRDLKPLSVEILHTRDPQTANDPAFVKPLTEATAVFFTNGHGHRIFDAYRGTLVERELKKLYARGGLIGGTDTGAAVLGDQLVARGEQDPLTEAGLGILPRFLIEDRRESERFPRTVAALPDHVCLMIDPDTAVIIRGHKLRVIGGGSVTVGDSGSEPKRVVLTAGGQLDVAKLLQNMPGPAAKK